MAFINVNYPNITRNNSVFKLMKKRREITEFVIPIRPSVTIKKAKEI